MPVQEQYEILPLKLWSPLQRRLAACGQVKGSPQQWIGTIRNLQKNGVSSAEITWSGVEGFLIRQVDRRIPLPELLNFLETQPTCAVILQRHITDEFSPVIQFDKVPVPKELPHPTVKKGEREVRLLHYRERSFGVCIWFNTGYYQALFGRQKYWTVSVPVGRKHFPRFDSTMKFANPVRAMAFGRSLIRAVAQRFAEIDFIGPIQSRNHFSRYALPGGGNYTEWLITAPNLPVSYYGPHFDVPNLVAHIRTTERLSPDIGSVLVVEEIQSDWNQALREIELHGQLITDDDDVEEDAPPDNPFRYHWVDAALRMMLLLAANRSFAAIAWLPGWIHAERFPWANSAGLRGFYDELLPKAVSKLSKSWGATMTDVSVPALTRNFVVREAKGRNGYLVVEKASNREIDHRFPSIREADECRLTLETPTTEQVPALLISEAMRADLIATGLPCLGAVGRRA
jgi:hypothetical protein